MAATEADKEVPVVEKNEATNGADTNGAEKAEPHAEAAKAG